MDGTARDYELDVLDRPPLAQAAPGHAQVVVVRVPSPTHRFAPTAPNPYAVGTTCAPRLAADPGRLRAVAEGSPKEQEPVPSAERAEQPGYGSKALRRADRELTEEEVQSPAVIPMLVEQTRRLAEENASLSRKLDQSQQQFHTADTERAVLRAENQVKWIVDVVSPISTAIGGLIIGVAYPALALHKEFAGPAIGLGSALMVLGFGAVIARALVVTLRTIK